MLQTIKFSQFFFKSVKVGVTIHTFCAILHVWKVDNLSTGHGGPGDLNWPLYTYCIIRAANNKTTTINLPGAYTFIKKSQKKLTCSYRHTTTSTPKVLLAH